MPPLRLVTPTAVLHLTPLIRGRRRIERLAACSAALLQLSQRHRWLAWPLLPLQLLLRARSRAIYRHLGRTYSLPPRPFWAPASDLR